MPYQVERHIRSEILESLTYSRITLVMGARQSGKSTLVQKVASDDHMGIRNLDDQVTREAAVKDPTGFVAELKSPTVIDEVQRAPDLLLAIKQSVDADTTPGRFLLTGSANILSAPKIYDALPGRIAIVRLWPFSQAEVEAVANNLVDALFANEPPQISSAPIGREAWVARAVTGGFPEVRQRPAGKPRSVWFRDYVTTIIERDLGDLSSAHKLEEIPRLLRRVASQAANLLLVSQISQRLELNVRTVQSYLRLLETVFILKTIPAWRPGIGAREVHKPKVYVTDTGLLADLLGADESRVASDDQLTGKIFENFVGMELIKHLSWAQTRGQLYHYRHDKNEVDIVMENQAGDIVACEVKASASLKARDWHQLTKLRDARNDSFRAGVVFYTGAQTIPLGDRLWALPVSSLWS